MTACIITDRWANFLPVIFRMILNEAMTGALKASFPSIKKEDPGFNTKIKHLYILTLENGVLGKYSVRVSESVRMSESVSVSESVSESE